jgi:lysophospholipase L1-like esterase
MKYPSYVALASHRSLPDGLTVDATSNTLNSRMGLTAPTAGSVTDVILSYPQFSLNIPEVDFGVTYTVTAAIEYPAGTFTPVWTAAGSRTLTVVPGRGLISFLPCPIVIPAGERFWIKTFASWTPGNFFLSAKCASWVSGDGTQRGTGLSDNTLVAGTPTTTSIAGFGPSVYGRLGAVSAVLGVIGDSISQTATEPGNPVTGWQFFQRAMRGVIPVLNTGRNSDSMAIYQQRYDGRSAAFRDRITHLWMALGRNDCGVGTLSAMKSNYAKIIDPYLARGIPVYGNTITPNTTSTDGWISRAGQTVVVSGNREAIRVEFNEWLRANWRSLGLTSLADWAHVIDPTDSGLWSFDPVGTGRSAQGFATLDANGAVATCVMGSYLLVNNSGGQAYQASTSIPCGVLTYPGGTGGGAVIKANANGSGLITTYSIESPGSGYDYPPMVSPMGSWTHDGIHPDSRGYDLIIAGCQMGPEMFSF